MIIQQVRGDKKTIRYVSRGQTTRMVFWRSPCPRLKKPNQRRLLSRVAVNDEFYPALCSFIKRNEGNY